MKEPKYIKITKDTFKDLESKVNIKVVQEPIREIKLVGYKLVVTTDDDLENVEEILHEALGKISCRVRMDLMIKMTPTEIQTEYNEIADHEEIEGDLGGQLVDTNEELKNGKRVFPSHP